MSSRQLRGSAPFPSRRHPTRVKAWPQPRSVKYSENDVLKLCVRQVIAVTIFEAAVGRGEPRPTVLTPHQPSRPYPAPRA